MERVVRICLGIKLKKLPDEKLKAKKYSNDYFLDISAGIIGSIGSIVAAWNRVKNNKAYIKPDNKLSYAEKPTNVP